MQHVVLVFDSSLGVDATALAREWADDEKVRPHLAGKPVTRRQSPAVYRPTILEDVVIPLAVNLGSSGLFEITRHLLQKHRLDGKSKVEVIDTAPGEQTVMITEAEDTDEDEDETPS